MARVIRLLVAGNACAGSVAAVSRRGKRGRSVGGLPSPRREFGEAAVWPVVDELAEHVGQIGFGVYAVQFARFDQRRENGPVLGAQVVAGKGVLSVMPILA
jgi:hypothetical protein